MALPVPRVLGVPMSKVTITTAGHIIELEQDGVSARELSRLALKVWRKTRDPRLDVATATGFALTTERSDPFTEPRQ
jgi:hypothetical protein